MYLRPAALQDARIWQPRSVRRLNAGGSFTGLVGKRREPVLLPLPVRSMGSQGAAWGSSLRTGPIGSVSMDLVTVSEVPLSRWCPSPGRFTRLVLGLSLFGAGEALLVGADLGVSPWTVLAQGVSIQIGLSVGAATVLTSCVLLVLWIALRQRPGLGTLLNAVLVGVFIDLTLALLPDGMPLGVRALLVLAGIALVGLGSGLYLTSLLGPGPRDGLMTGLHRRTGLSLRLVRVCIEVSAVSIGFVLGGTVGVGTVVFALLIGPAVQAGVHALGGRDTASL